MKHFFLALVALICTFATLFTPVTFYSKQEMEHVELGYPLPFYVQSLNLDPETFPETYSLLSPWEYSKAFYFNNFFLSYGFFFLLMELVAFMIGKLRNSVK